MTNKKAAELPLNFIVIAAIAVIVLIIIVMFIFSGFRTEAINSQTAANSCSVICFAKQRAAVDETKAVGIATMDKNYCAKQDIKGFSSPVDCTTLSPCTLAFSDGDCAVKSSTAITPLP
ncbi:MAG: hypothetical protein PHC66_03710, partial [Candidatus Nanoarchaeia archaeon]|nr:hypothetical protein [Candidatus Nanoarchaeia archaeon]